jgi:histidyl-tRNA synthetase
MGIAKQLRSASIATELYPDHSKMKKQMAYADAKKIPFVILVGTEEMSSGKLTLKNMQTGEQSGKSIEEIIEELKD